MCALKTEIHEQEKKMPLCFLSKFSEIDLRGSSAGVMRGGQLGVLLMTFLFPEPRPV